MSGANNSVALVTGARRGIGCCIAEVLAQEGYALALLDVEPANETLEGVRAIGADAESFVADVSNEHDVNTSTAVVLERFGRVDILVNNAGIKLVLPAEETTAAQWRRVLDVNLTGPFLVSRAFGRSMLERRRGSIINVASLAGLKGIADRAAYCASKHGVIGLTRTLAAEWGGRGVRVNAVCPSWVRGENDVPFRSHANYTESDIVGKTPMGRLATPEDVALGVAFLADEGRSGFINGHALSVDGGWSADGGWHQLRLSKRGGVGPLSALSMSRRST
jgi:NAD(P)-dependent dehydrogenase (short-subunit alcohol dehydrogenase family)